MNAPARAARFAADPFRRSMLAKVHIAKVQLGLSDDDYRAVLLRVTGRLSSAKCSNRELADLLDEFKRKGFVATAAAPGKPKPADHPVAAKARALWISLYHLGAIEDSSEAALEAFARRQLKVERLQWANQALGYRLIEALKAIGARHGWDADLTGVDPGAQVIALKRRLCGAIMDKLIVAELAPAEWPIDRAAWEFGGLTIKFLFATTEELDRVARVLGDKLRRGTK